VKILPSFSVNTDWQKMSFIKRCPLSDWALIVKPHACPAVFIYFYLWSKSLKSFCMSLAHAWLEINHMPLMSVKITRGPRAMIKARHWSSESDRLVLWVWGGDVCHTALTGQAVYRSLIYIPPLEAMQLCLSGPDWQVSPCSGCLPVEQRAAW